ncbi:MULTISPECIES: fumarylacetoacetate hydrolase family protein [Sphingomonas]|jgi:fumarylacetoacetate (FAA) hydrolase family protein|uniref:Fumarylacetoacetate hydrolase n=1 Tax=Sphingomonas hankookensis TaxID=563996 RepID=A0ABR5YGG7_9SPHN|nr:MULTISPECIES: fumarylacetoacetate hydrolase family protein [Sphingomonas]KZE18782.1 fumarylacetoacetate hydrolase [Sphingomonas hankookensis]WCP70680.1 fumarylacetoacetate hydrolase family protein [Sphingomonas hankookensis]
MKSEHAARMLPADHDQALLVGRMQLADGPTPVVVKGGKVIDVSAHAATVADLLECSDIASLDGPVVCDTAALADPAGEHPPILSPIDLQCVKAAGVTFAVSALERVIEERARGDADAAQGIRGDLEARIGGGIRSVKPGSSEAAELKAALIDAGMWSQYLEVAIGPDAEVFTKAPVLSTIGWGGEVGIRSDSSWNNPEPEIVVVATSDGKIVGATLGNDVNLRDFEGRSALLLGKAKDNNASTGIGPFIRLFDGTFTMDTVRDAVVDLRIDGPEGYVLTGTSTMREISRDPEDLVRQALSEHQYPDGFVLFLGTLFAPVQDRDEPGRGFTHKPGDVVRISTTSLGELVNTVTTSKVAEPWRFGIRDLMRNLARRGLIAA